MNMSTQATSDLKMTSSDVEASLVTVNSSVANNTTTIIAYPFSYLAPSKPQISSPYELFHAKLISSQLFLKQFYLILLFFL